MGTNQRDAFISMIFPPVRFGFFEYSTFMSLVDMPKIEQKEMQR